MTSLCYRIIMRAGAWVATALAITLMLPSSIPNAYGAGVPVPSLGKALRSTPGLTIPAAWAGVWATADTVHFCSDPTILFTGAGSDTFCTGASVEQNAGDVTLTCTGTMDDVSANIHCTGTDEVSPGCVVDYDMTIVSTRNGDSSFTENTINTTYQPPFCDSAPNSCLVIETTSTRIEPQPPTCVTPVQPGTWGMLKARYR